MFTHVIRKLFQKFLNRCAVKLDCIKILELVIYRPLSEIALTIAPKIIMLGGWVDGWMEVKSGLRIASSH